MDYNRGDGKYSLKYGGGYVQDDWRVSSQFTLNYGLRFEHESGLRERDNHITVGFDPNATSPELQAIDAAIRKNGYTGPALKGGLMFAGVNGAHDYQGNPPAVKVSPRVLRELEAAHRELIAMHLEKDLKSMRVLREMRR